MTSQELLALTTTFPIEAYSVIANGSYTTDTLVDHLVNAFEEYDEDIGSLRPGGRHANWIPALIQELERRKAIPPKLVGRCAALRMGI